jgi:hypothetical protein
MQNALQDPLLTGVSSSTNPFRPQKVCSFLWGRHTGQTTAFFGESFFFGVCSPLENLNCILLTTSPSQTPLKMVGGSLTTYTIILLLCLLLHTLIRDWSHLWWQRELCKSYQRLDSLSNQRIKDYEFSNYRFTHMCSASGPTHWFLDQLDSPECVWIWWRVRELLRSRHIAEKKLTSMGIEFGWSKESG